MNCLSEPSAPYIGYNYPQPLGKFMAEFDRSRVQKRMTPSQPNLYARALWDFFSRFPQRRDPTKFYITDIEDYKALKASEGLAPNTIRNRLCVIRTFFNWMIREAGVEMTNPVIVPPLQRKS